MDYPGKVIRKTPVTPTQTSASGVWTLDDAIAATKTNTWPVAGVPNPISRSLRFNSADSAYLNRTFTTPTNNKLFTWSGWVKRCGIGVWNDLFGAGGSNGFGFNTSWNDNGLAFFTNNATGGDYFFLVTTQVFRDPSSWYHIVLAVDTTQATASNRAKLYVNGSQITAFNSAVYQSQNSSLTYNSAVAHYVGSLDGTTRYMNGYMTEVNFIDGQALTPSSFGMTDPQTGAWEPIKYTGTYGTNGFYLNFSDNSSTSALGNDYSGNGNNWTTNNFSVTAGAGNDSLTDVPTPWIAYNTTGDVGGVVRGNYATWNPLIATATLSNGNLDFSQTNTKTAASMGVTSGKWYCEVTCNTTANRLFIVGVAKVGDNSAFNLFASGVGYYADNGEKYVDGTTSAYGATYTAGDIIGIALNMDAGTVTFYKNNTSQGSINLPTSSQGYYPLAIQAASGSTSATWTANFGQRPFAYTPPAGFLSLCTTNLPTPTIGATSTTQAGKYFNTVLYTGNNSTQSITGVGFQPDFIWIKGRSQIGASHTLVNAVTGNTKYLFTNQTAAEETVTDAVTSFNSDGFSLGANSQGVYPYVNFGTGTFVSWNWKANGAGSSNTAGSIQSTVSANTTAGFSIVTYTGTGVAATVGHGLGVAPNMVIVKRRNGAVEWPVYHVSIGNDKYLYLNTTAAASTFAMWNNTTPTSTVFSIGVASDNNANTGTYVAYCFAAIAGYSAFGSFVANGSSDNAFIYTGFQPRFVMWKRSDGVNAWGVVDTARGTTNAIGPYLLANASDAEATATLVDILSNGFKMRNSGFGNGETYIYMAFAEFPFKFSNAR